MTPEVRTNNDAGDASHFSPWAYKSALVGLVVLALTVPLALVAVPFIEFFNGMAAQPKGKTQMTYGRVAGKELPVGRLPVTGTVHLDQESYRFEHLGKKIEDARKVGIVLTNPIAPAMENLRRGRKLYNTYCIVCHGEQGRGDGSVTGPDRFPAPPSFHTDQARGYKDGTIYHIITKGLEKMPDYADKLEPDERWMVIHYLRVLQRAMNPKPEDLTP